MGSHTWTDQCPYCGFEEMTVSSHNSFYFEVVCQIYGYARWTEEKIPDARDIEFAKQALGEMDTKEKLKVTELYDEDNLPLVIRLKKAG